MSNDMTGLTPSQVYKLMLGHFRSGDYRTNLYLEGHHGIGKTEMVLQAALEVFGTEEQKKMPLSVVLGMTYAERGWVFERDYPATKNVEDYTGVPRYNPETGLNFGIGAGVKGVLVTSVAPRSVAMDKGLRAGFIVTAVGTRDIEGLQDFYQEVKKAGGRKPILILVRSPRGDAQATLAIPPR